MPSKTTAISDESDQSKPWHRRLGWRAFIVILALSLFAAWHHGTFDHALVNVGLNAKECAHNGFGATFCGEELDVYRERQKNAAQEGKETTERVEREGKEYAAKLQQEAKQREERILQQSAEAQRQVEAEAEAEP